MVELPCDYLPVNFIDLERFVICLQFRIDLRLVFIHPLQVVIELFFLLVESSLWHKFFSRYFLPIKLLSIESICQQKNPQTLLDHQTRYYKNEQMIKNELFQVALHII
jgi:hypothetical protein